jgi:hypothetical protein
MKRTPIIRRTPLKRSQKPIPKRSKSPVRLARLALYEQAKAEAKATLMHIQRVAAWTGGPDPLCEWPGCISIGTDCHHTHGRTGTNLYDKTKLRFLCRRHHQEVHHDPKAARALGLIN